MGEPETAPRRDRQVLLVLGMHRSGTSAAAGLLMHLGADMARTPIRSDADNARGYWEPLPIVELHDRLLAEAGGGWDDWVRLDPERIGAGAADALTAAYVAEFGAAPLAVLKDPRLSRFLPLWLDVLGRLGIAPLAVIALRHPLEVARSLERRDGMPQDEALLLWLRYSLEIERGTRGLPRSFLRYDDLIADWRAAADRLAAELGLAWPVPPAAVAETVDGFLDGAMRHHAARPADFGANPQLAAWIDAGYAALEDLARGGDRAEAEARLDALAAALADADALIGATTRRQRHAALARAAALADGLVAARAEAAAQAAAAHAAAVARAEAEARHAAAAAAAAAALAEVEARLAAAETHAARLEAARAALIGSTSWRLTAPLRQVAARLRRPRPPASAPAE